MRFTRMYGVKRSDEKEGGRVHQGLLENSSGISYFNAFVTKVPYIVTDYMPGIYVQVCVSSDSALEAPRRTKYRIEGVGKKGTNNV